MKIKAKCSFAGVKFSATSGQVLDLPVDIANDLINAGYAEAENEDKRNQAGDDPKPIKGIRRSAK